MAICLFAGLDGIERELMPPESTSRNIYDMTPEERAAEGIETLPGSLEEALIHFKKSAFSKNALGDHVFEKYAEAKDAEWENYRTSISQWELDNYLIKY